VRIVPQPDQTDANAGHLGLHRQLSDFLEWIKPYRELFILAGAVVATISAAVGWVAGHFATRAELSSLDCRITNSLHGQLIAFKSDLADAGVNWRLSQIKQMTVEDPRPVAATLTRLQQEVDELRKQQTSWVGDMQKKMEELNRGCPNSGISMAKN
jgi:hypothetical protein